MSFKIVVKPTVKNKEAFRRRGLFYSDNEVVKDLAKEIAKTKVFSCYIYDKDEYEYLKQLIESLGIVINKRD